MLNRGCQHTKIKKYFKMYEKEFLLTKKCIEIIKAKKKLYIIK